MAECKDCIHNGLCKIYSDFIRNHDCELFVGKADVVPRSEVDTLREIRDLCNATILEQGVQIYKLKISDASKEECTIRQHNEIKELRAELNKVKQEVAREIFEEIDRIVSEYCDRFIPPTEMVAMLFDLKKKYTESEGND